MDKPIWFVLIQGTLGIAGILFSIFILLIHARLSKKSIPDIFMVFMSACNLFISVSVIMLAVYSSISDDIYNYRDRIFESAKAGINIAYGIGLVILAITRFMKTFRPKKIGLRTHQSKRAFLTAGSIVIIIIGVHFGIYTMPTALYALTITEFIVFMLIMITLVSIYTVIFLHLRTALKDWETMKRNGKAPTKKHKENVPGTFNNSVHPQTEESTSHSSSGNAAIRKLSNEITRKKTLHRQPTSSEIQFSDDGITEQVNVTSGSSCDERRFHLANCKKSAKTTKIFFAITISFLICQVLYWIIYILSVSLELASLNEKNAVRLLLDVRLLWSLIDPVVYTAMNSVYRKRVKELIRRS